MWRNGWFHTGDAFVIDADGNYAFLDRMRDTIRRRGENISSFEVENAVVGIRRSSRSWPSACRPRSARTVFVVVIVRYCATFDPAELITYLAESSLVHGAASRRRGRVATSHASRRRCV